MTSITELFSIPIEAALVKEHSDRLVTDDMVGIEIELEGLISIPLLREITDTRWNVVEDGSLRNGGAEFVFSEPMFGVDVVQALTNLRDTLGRVGVEPELTERTSVHVHIDVRDLEYSQILNFILIYLICEPYFFAVGGEERRHNPYSFPLAMSDDYLRRIGAAMQYNNGAPTAAMFTSNIDGAAKYSAFNVAPISTQGSIEFRHHRGTYNVEELLRWVNMVLCIKRQTVAMGTTRLTTEYIDNILSSRYHEFIGEVFNGVDVPHTANGWEQAVSVAKRVAYRATTNNISPVLNRVEYNSENHLFLRTQEDVGSQSIEDQEYFISRMYDRCELLAEGSITEIRVPTSSTFNLGRSGLSQEAIDRVRRLRYGHEEEDDEDDEDMEYDEDGNEIHEEDE